MPPCAHCTLRKVCRKTTWVPQSDEKPMWKQSSSGPGTGPAVKVIVPPTCSVPLGGVMPTSHVSPSAAAISVLLMVTSASRKYAVPPLASATSVFVSELRRVKPSNVMTSGASSSSAPPVRWVDDTSEKAILPDDDRSRVRLYVDPSVGMMMGR